MNNQEKIKVRCSSLGALFTNPKTKKAQEAGEVSETTKTMARDMWLKNEFGFDEPLVTKQLIKGITQEQDSMKLVSLVLGGFRMRHAENIQNDFITGTPDIVLQDCVEDIKTSWNIRTFMNAELSKQYERQLQGYMMLSGKEKARLIYCLVPTDQNVIVEEKKKFYFKFDCNEENPDYVAASLQIDHNNNMITKIPEESRVKVFEIERDEAFADEVKARVERVREFYKTLKL